MKISTRLKLGVYIPITMALIIIAALGFSFQQIGKIQQNGDTVRQIRSSITELNHFVFSYTLYHEERPQQQFLAEHENLTGLIAGIHFSNPDQQQLLDSIRQNNETVADLFSRLVSANEGGDTAGADRLVGLLLLRSYEADTSASLLRNMIDDEIRRSEILMAGLILSVLTVATVPLTVILRRTRRSITSSLSHLSRGAAVIGTGNLDYRIEEKGNDEITELSRSFNRMAAHLKTVTASKADLEIEVAARKEAEDELKAANNNLQEQTIKLEEEVVVRRKAEQQTQELVEEMKVHQEELEAQAEELRQAQVEARESRDKYLDLYDYAPVGYLTLEKGGGILEANLTAAGMLGVARSELVHTQISKFILPDSQDTFYFHGNQVFETGARQKCEVRMHRGDGATFYAKLESIPANSEGKTKQLRTSLSDITERKKAEEELKKHRNHLEELVATRTQELRELSHRLVDAQEKERALIGSELHDEVGQYMTYATMLIERALRKPDSQILIEAKSSVQEAISQIRNLSSMLSPRILRSAGLVPALSSLIEGYGKRMEIKVDFACSSEFEGLTEEAALAAYRIVQEALTNVARHAKASEVKIKLSQEGDKLHLEVADNGTGFTSEDVKHSTGLTGMRERALALGGEFNINSKPGQGTRITAEIPLTGKENE